MIEFISVREYVGILALVLHCIKCLNDLTVESSYFRLTNPHLFISQTICLLLNVKAHKIWHYRTGIVLLFEISEND